MTQKAYTQEEYWYRPLPETAPNPAPAESKTPVLSEEGLPWQAYAVVVDRADPHTWHLPHHTKLVKKVGAGGGNPDPIGTEKTVDWKAMPRMVYLLSRYGRQAEKLPLDPGQVLHAASHLATHYIKADKPVPDALAVLSYIDQ